MSPERVSILALVGLVATGTALPINTGAPAFPDAICGEWFHKHAAGPVWAAVVLPGWAS